MAFLTRLIACCVPLVALSDGNFDEMSLVQTKVRLASESWSGTFEYFHAQDCSGKPYYTTSATYLMNVCLPPPASELPVIFRCEGGNIIEASYDDNECTVLTTRKAAGPDYVIKDGPCHPFPIASIQCDRGMLEVLEKLFSSRMRTSSLCYAR